MIKPFLSISKLFKPINSSSGASHMHLKRKKKSVDIIGLDGLDVSN